MSMGPVLKLFKYRYPHFRADHVETDPWQSIIQDNRLLSRTSDSVWWLSFYRGTRLPRFPPGRVGPVEPEVSGGGGSVEELPVFALDNPELTVENNDEVPVPITVTAPMTATEISTAISAYSMATAASSSSRNCRIERFVFRMVTSSRAKLSQSRSLYMMGQ